MTVLVRGARYFRRMVIPTIWHERYHCPEGGPFPSVLKQKEVVEAALAAGLIELRSDRSFDAAEVWRQIEAVHEEAYVEAVRTGEPRGLAQSPGLLWAPERVESVARIWSGHVEACRLALEEGVVFHPVSGAHHARRRCGGGFCTFNFLVGAARAILDSKQARRVLVVDLDTHHGNGTWELVGEEKRIGVFDLSGSPQGTPIASAKGRFSSLVSSAEPYFEQLGRLPAFVDTFAPDLIQFQAGMDCHEDDRVGGIPGMTAERLRKRDAFVFETARSRGIPLVFNLAGGYQGKATVELHLATVREAWNGR